MCKLLKSITIVACGILVLSGSAYPQTSLTAKNAGYKAQPVREVVESDRVKDGLIGPVRRVRTEIVKLTSLQGKVVEGKRALLEIAAYDIKGNKTENQYFPVAAGTLTGKEVYKYDDRGNIAEMTLLKDDGTLLSRETYKYEFDFAGNWNKMTTSVAVVDSGRVSFEPTEVTYRSIMYYLDENMVKMVQPGERRAGQPSSQTSLAKAVVESKTPQTTAPTSSVPATANDKGSSLTSSVADPANMNAVGSVEVKNAPESETVSSMMPVTMVDEPPPMPAMKPILKPVSGGVLNGVALKLPAPLYPDSAKRLRVSGVVSVQVVVDETGKVIVAEATNGPNLLRETAIQAALRARFSPTKLSGQPVKVTGTINYRFALAQ